MINFVQRLLLIDAVFELQSCKEISIEQTCSILKACMALLMCTLKAACSLLRCCACKCFTVTCSLLDLPRSMHSIHFHQLMASGLSMCPKH